MSGSNIHTLGDLKKKADVVDAHKESADRKKCTNIEEPASGNKIIFGKGCKVMTTTGKGQIGNALLVQGDTHIGEMSSKDTKKSNNPTGQISFGEGCEVLTSHGDSQIHNAQVVAGDAFLKPGE